MPANNPARYRINIYVHREGFEEVLKRGGTISKLVNDALCHAYPEYREMFRKEVLPKKGPKRKNPSVA